MSLLGLSDELLIQIISGDSPLDSFGITYTTFRTCRRLNAVARTVRSTRVSCSTPFRSADIDTNHYTIYLRRFDLYPERSDLVHYASLECHRPRDKADEWDMMVDLASKYHRLRELRLKIGLLRIIVPDPGLHMITTFPGFMDSPFDEKRNLVTMLHLCSFKDLRKVVLEHEGVELVEILAFLALPVIESLEVIGLRGDTLTTTSASSPSTLKNLTISCTTMPTGAAIECLFTGLSSLQYLCWTAEVYPRFCAYDHDTTWRPSDIVRALLPCQNSLRSLELAMKISQFHFGHSALDLTSFSCLSSVKINSRIIFPGDMFAARSPPAIEYIDYLPSSLRFLEIVFDEEHSAMLPNYTDNPASDWYLSVARMKTIRFPGLKFFQISEVVHWFKAKQRQWDYPEDVGSVFEKAGIVLNVCLRVKDRIYYEVAPENRPQFRLSRPHPSEWCP